MKGLPIEPGCLALVVPDHPSKGVSVKVIKVAPPVYRTSEGNTFRMLPPARSGWVCEGRMVHYNLKGEPMVLNEAVIDERYLRRIDGPPEITETTLDLSKEVVLTP